MTSNNQGACAKCNQANAYTKVVCDFCGARLPWASAAVAPATPVPTVTPSPQKKLLTGTLSPKAQLGRVLMLIGSGITLYFFQFYDTSVSAGGGMRVNNLGLMSDRQNGILVGMGLVIVGTLLWALDARNSN